MQLQEMIRIDFAGLRALAKADGAEPFMLDPLADARLAFYANKAMSNGIESVHRILDETWWDRGRCSVAQIRRELELALERGDMHQVMTMAAMILVRECADQSVCTG